MSNKAEEETTQRNEDKSGNCSTSKICLSWDETAMVKVTLCSAICCNQLVIVNLGINTIVPPDNKDTNTKRSASE